MGAGGGSFDGGWRYSTTSSTSTLTRQQKRQVIIQGIFLVLGFVLLAGLTGSIYVAGEDKKSVEGGCGGRCLEVEGIPLGKWLISKEEDECEG